MTGPGAQAPADAPARGRHLLLYDGACGLCHRAVTFVLRHDRRADFVFAPLQSGLGRGILTRSGRSPDALDTVLVVADYESAPRLLARSDAALFVLGALGGRWRPLGLLRVVPAALRDAVYDLIARRRRRWFGGADECALPDESARQRFLDR